MLHQQFRLPVVKARYLNLHSTRTTTREKGNDFEGWAIYTDGGTRVSEGETSAGWRAVARSPDGMLYIISRLARSLRPKHISRMHGPETIPTTLLNSRVPLRRLPCLGPMARLPVILKRVSSTIPGMRLAFAWALSNHARTSPCGSLARVSCY